MSTPESPRAWLKYAVRVLEAQASAFSPRYDGMPRSDHRLSDSRETALSVKIMAERASAACTKNGLGLELLVDYYVREASWRSFTAREKRVIKKTAAKFADALREARFLPEN